MNKRQRKKSSKEMFDYDLAYKKASKVVRKYGFCLEEFNRCRRCGEQATFCSNCVYIPPNESE